MRRYTALSVLTCAAILLGACEKPPENVVPGYIEGDYQYIGPEDAGRIAVLDVSEGVHVDAGAPLFRLDSTAENAALAAAEARAASARASLADLQRGARQQRIDLLGATVNRAAAEYDLAVKELRRVEELFLDGTIAESRRDAAKTLAETTEARLQEARKDLELARLPERDDLIAAARATALAAEKDAENRRHLLERRTVSAPAAALVHEVLRRQGETVPAGSAVVALLPDDARHAVFFVAQAAVAGLHLGDDVALSCDGCPDGLTARIDLISNEVEFTPPVIYGTTERKRLVVRIEAAIAAGAATALKPGLPVSVSLPK